MPVDESFALHPLTPDESATAESMAGRERSGRVLAMPTHHFGDYGDLTGFRYECAGSASAACLPVSRRTFFGHTMAECLDGERDILRVMSQPGENRRVMREFLEATERDCSAALLDCVPDNSDAITGHGLLQVKQRNFLMF